MKKFKIFAFLLLSGLIVQAQQPLSLTDAIAKALENNYDILLAKGDQQVAEIKNNWGAAGRYPYINLSASDNNSYVIQESDNNISNRFSGGTSLSWTIFDGFSVKISKARLDELENISKNNTATMVEGTIQSIILAYYDVLLQKEKLVTYEEVMNLSNDRYEREKQRKEYGSAVTYEVLQAQNAYLEDRASYLLQEVAYKNSRRNLGYLMAEKENTDYHLSEKFEAVLEEYLLADLLTQMLENNKSLQTQFINLRLLDNQIASSKSAYSPYLDFNGGVTGTTTRMKTVEQDASWSKNATLYGNFTLGWNLFSGGNRKRAVQIAEIDRELGDVQLADIQHNLSNRLANLFEFYEVRKELLVLAKENLEAARLNMQISREKFESGAINSFNYRDVQQIYLNAAQGELQAIYYFIDAQTSLLRLAGVIVQQYD
ncbi:TolC family protein [Prolixibacteraceae bacterium Z1-6]|uniref:TolC family protein n=1 Tax=Draconibacterium aestuarii TaxID=2998507 RepID=A0A9X3FEM6_9BACT|nr:TolC family protein [Prolixibacteraceae bacterium Z1-6]